MFTRRMWLCCSITSLAFAPPWMFAERTKKLSLIHSMTALVSGALSAQNPPPTSFSSSAWMFSPEDISLSSSHQWKGKLRLMSTPSAFSLALGLKYFNSDWNLLPMTPYWECVQVGALCLFCWTLSKPSGFRVGRRWISVLSTRNLIHGFLSRCYCVNSLNIIYGW